MDSLKKLAWMALLASLTAGAAWAQAQSPSVIRVMVVADQSDEGSELLTLAVAGTPLQRLLGKVIVLPIRDLADALRATRTGEYDVIVAPAHVAASAIVHNYELIAASTGQTKYVLIGATDVKSVADLKGRRAYFPGQDSLRSYVARGLLAQEGLTPRSMKNVTYGLTTGAGLLTVAAGGADATVALEGEWATWSKTNPKAGVVLAMSRDMPDGVAVVVKKDTPDNVRRAVMQWVTASDTLIPNAGRIVATTNIAPYQYVASLGLFTPEELQGVQRVSAKQALALAQRGAKLVDVRTEREYSAKHARGAILVPYGEKSLKAIDFDPGQDSFSGVNKLDKSEPVVFFCNGPECWKSYKASKVARDLGFKQVFWLRGGMPEWNIEGLPTSP